MTMHIVYLFPWISSLFPSGLLELESIINHVDRSSLYSESNSLYWLIDWPFDRSIQNDDGLPSLAQAAGWTASSCLWRRPLPLAARWARCRQAATSLVPSFLPFSSDLYHMIWIPEQAADCWIESKEYAWFELKYNQGQSFFFEEQKNKDNRPLTIEEVS